MTMSVGQSEVDDVAVAATTVVHVTTGRGVDIQAEKADVLEVADVFVVNKADRPGADETRVHLESMLGNAVAAWRPPVVEVTATSGEGVAELWSAIGRHRAWRQVGGQRPSAPRASPQSRQ